MIVGEPTSNYPYVGHKGSLKFHARFRGVSAHGSMPELGVNAIYKAVRAVAKLESFDFGQPAHPVMGKPTMNVGTFQGGNTVNSVPDAASFGVDIRTVPGIDHAALRAKLQAVLGNEAELEVFSDMNAVWTEPDQDWVQAILARAISAELGTAVGRKVIVENRTGAGGTIGTASVAKAAPDGHTLILSAASHTINGSLYAKLPYDPIRDFTGVAHIGTVEYVLMITAALPPKTVREFVDYAKANAGKLNYTTAGSGTATHLSMAYFASLAGIDMVHVPYKATNEAVNEVVAGRSHAVIAAPIAAPRVLNGPPVRLVAV